MGKVVCCSLNYCTVKEMFQNSKIYCDAIAILPSDYCYAYSLRSSKSTMLFLAVSSSDLVLDLTIFGDEAYCI